VNCFYVGDTHLYTASNDKTIKVWRLDTGALLKTLEGHIQGVCCLAMNDGLLYSGSFDSTIMKWDIKDMACVNTYKGHIEVRSYLHYFVFCFEDALPILLTCMAKNKKTQLYSPHSHMHNFAHKHTNLRSFVEKIIYSPILTHIHTHTYFHTHTHTHIHLHMCTYRHTHIFTNTHLHTHACMHTYIHTYMHMHTERRR
jgi:WD40 repeat protein